MKEISKVFLCGFLLVLPEAAIEIEAFSCHPYILCQRPHLSLAQKRDFVQRSPLFLGHNSTELQDEGTVISRELVVTDLLAIAIACQLLGLLDAINSETFASRGGWLQPVTVNSFRTLPLLVERFAENSVLWLSAAALVEAKNSQSTLFERAIWDLLLFVVLRLSLVLLVSRMSHEGLPLLALEAAREVYFVGVVVLAARYTSSKIYP